MLSKLQCMDKAFYRFADISRALMHEGENADSPLQQALYVGFQKLQRVEAVALTQLNSGDWGAL